MRAVLENDFLSTISIRSRRQRTREGMKCRLVLDFAIIRKSATVFELLASEDETTHTCRNDLHIVDRVGRFDLQRVRRKGTTTKIFFPR